MWEKIDRWHYRMRVPGGWIVEFRSIPKRNSHFGTETALEHIKVAMTFVPDPNHEWVLETGVNEAQKELSDLATSRR